MFRSISRLLLCGALLMFFGAAWAGGAWLPGKGQGNVQFGFSRKTADNSWDDEGNVFQNGGRYENHDFRYWYLAGEAGISKKVSFHWLLTYLYGLEGPDGNLEKNEGPSDMWFGLKFALREGKRPMALKLEVRSPVLYDIEGPYERDLYDEDGNFLGHSPEWRGILKHDYTATWLMSDSIPGGRGWWNVETGYTYREGAPADQWPLNADVGVKLPGFRSHFKFAFVGVKSLGNDTERRPDDRFGSRPGFNFNDASMARIGASWLADLDRNGTWYVEIGFNRWIWGRSARRYDEPFLSFSRRF